MTYLVKEIIDIRTFRLTLRFNTDEIVEVDLYEKLCTWSQSPDSKFKMLMDEDYFKTVKLDPEAETIYWDNGIDLYPDVLYEMGNVVQSIP